MIINYCKELDFIKSAMAQAFSLYGKSPLHTANKTAFDLVTDIDLNIEKYVTAQIKQAFPDDKVLGEEFTSCEMVQGRTWTVDPIDGTCNMAAGSKLFGMQCSLIENGEIVLGVVYLPHLDEWIYATLNSGCYCNGEKISVASNTTLENALVSFGDYPHKKGGFTADIEHDAIKYLYPRIAKIRMFGAACMDFSFVAQGRTHGTVVITKNLWDIAPGIIICKEAGAIVSDLKGFPYKIGCDGVIAAANAEVFDVVTKAFQRKISVKKGKKTADFKACVFDFDGVIVDTEKYHYLAWKKAFKKFGINLTQKIYSPLKSTGKENIISVVSKSCGAELTDDKKTEICKIKTETFASFFDGISQRDMIVGAKELLELLKAKFIKTAVASSSSTTLELIDRLDLHQYFDVIIDGNSKFKKKPAPDVFCAAAKALSVTNGECLVFEDSIAGIEAALNCDMRVVAVGAVKADGAFARVRNLTEALALLKD